MKDAQIGQQSEEEQTDLKLVIRHHCYWSWRDERISAEAESWEVDGVLEHQQTS